MKSLVVALLLSVCIAGVSQAQEKKWQPKPVSEVLEATNHLDLHVNRMKYSMVLFLAKLDVGTNEQAAFVQSEVYSMTVSMVDPLYRLTQSIHVFRKRLVDLDHDSFVDGAEADLFQDISQAHNWILGVVDKNHPHHEEATLFLNPELLKALIEEPDFDFTMDETAPVSFMESWQIVNDAFYRLKNSIVPVAE
jgi:hypothetical protein